MKKDNYKQKSSSSKLSIFVKVVEFKSNDLKMFISTLAMIMLKIMIFKIVILSLKMFLN
jgi:hypothetical protein